MTCTATLLLLAILEKPQFCPKLRFGALEIPKLQLFCQTKPSWPEIASFYYCNFAVAGNLRKSPYLLKVLKFGEISPKCTYVLIPMLPGMNRCPLCRFCSCLSVFLKLVFSPNLNFLSLGHLYSLLKWSKWGSKLLCR